MLWPRFAAFRDNLLRRRVRPSPICRTGESAPAPPRGRGSRRSKPIRRCMADLNSLIIAHDDPPLIDLGAALLRAKGLKPSASNRRAKDSTARVAFPVAQKRHLAEGASIACDRFGQDVATCWFYFSTRLTPPPSNPCFLCPEPGHSFVEMSKHNSTSRGFNVRNFIATKRRSVVFIRVFLSSLAGSNRNIYS